MHKILWFLRLFVFYLGLTPVTILIATFGWLCAPLPASWCYRVITSWSHFFIWWAKIICGLKYKVTGKKNIPKTPFVVLCNHQSMWETIFMQVLLPPQSTVLKRELLFIPFFGWGLALIRPIAVSRNKLSDIKVILAQGMRRLGIGRCVIFYPEGTRLAPGVQHRYSRTGAALAIAAKVPVLPIAHNAGNFWPRGPWIKQPGLIEVHIGHKIEIFLQDPLTVTKLAKDWIDNQKSQMKTPG
jgi:1-acyl-sn-glycerol-3-phosphate acyltransferase